MTTALGTRSSVAVHVAELVVLLACRSTPPPAEAPAAARASAPSPVAVARAHELADRVLEREDLAAYRGWIKYLAFRAEQDAQPAQAVARLADWSQRVLDNPRVLSELRGIQEWAYESPVDGSGQPFRISLPAALEAQRPLPLSLHLHGTGANHLEFAEVLGGLTRWRPESSFLEVNVLGRGRGSGYQGLGEADVLQVLDYVAAHFPVDPDRIHLVGESMGGFGVSWLGARYPQRFASAWIVCGSAADIPLGNLLTLPVYATHSADDWSAPALMIRSPLQALLERGGKAVWDETTGLGHAVWGYREGNERARAWSFDQVRRQSRDVQHIDYTALDGNAVRGWWAEVQEWGAAARPARFAATVEGEVLKLELHNVRRLHLRLAESPLHAARAIAIQVRVSGHRAASSLRVGSASRSDSVVVAVDPDSGRATLEPLPAPQSPRLHTQGGPNQLYGGEPLLIVYGTGGSAALQQAQRAAAELASHSVSWGWSGPGPARAAQRSRYPLYGALRIKPDRELSEADIAQNHLVLIGTAAQNSFVQRIAPRLPVQLSSDRIEFSDGVRVPRAAQTLRLLHYNPEAPRRLIFWVASDNPQAYGPSWPLLDYLSMGPLYADALITDDPQSTLVLARSFDSRWHWTPRAAAPLLELEQNDWEAASRFEAEAARRVTRSDFALAAWFWQAQARPAFSPGITRSSDLMLYDTPLSVLKLTGRELLAAQNALDHAQRVDGQMVVALWPLPSSAQLEPERVYSVVGNSDGLVAFSSTTRLSPKDVALTNWSLADALQAPTR
ncbi:MAG: alpha/beta fold hydrolase [Deltaproteobacteria bacterium]